MMPLQVIPNNRQDRVLLAFSAASLIMGRFFNTLYVASDRTDFVGRTIGSVTLLSRACMGYMLHEAVNQQSQFKKGLYAGVTLAISIPQYFQEGRIWEEMDKGHFIDVRSFYTLSVLLIAFTALYVILRDREVNNR